MSTQEKYEDRERKLALRQIEELEKESAQLQKKAFEGFKQALTDGHFGISDLVSTRLRWLLDGCYGYGPMKLAHQAIEFTKDRKTTIPRNASLFRLIAAFEWQVKSYYASKAFKLMSKDRQAMMNNAFDRTVKEWEQEQEQEQRAGLELP